MSLYTAHILDHYHNPRNTASLSRPDHTITMTNGACGDELTVQVCFEGATLRDLSFYGTGCILSQAAASIVIHETVGKSCKAVQALTSNDVQALLRVPVGPNRMQCALLVIKALKTVAQQRMNP